MYIHITFDAYSYLSHHSINRRERTRKGCFIKKGEKLRREKAVELGHTLWKYKPSREIEVETPSDDEDNDSDPASLTWKHGRRVVDLAVLAKGLQACDDCGLPENQNPRHDTPGTTQVQSLSADVHWKTDEAHDRFGILHRRQAHGRPPPWTNC